MDDQHREAAQAPGAVLAPEPHTRPPHEATASHADGTVRAPLSCTRIIDAAVRYVDDNCLDELSMRRLGSELGVEAMSLYRYFPSKAASARCGRRPAAERPRPAGRRTRAPTGRSSVRCIFAVVPDLTLAHPNLMPLLSTMSPNDPPLADLHDRMVGLWREAGPGSGPVAESAQRALQCYLSGSSQWHQSTAPGRRGRGLRVRPRRVPGRIPVPSAGAHPPDPAAPAQPSTASPFAASAADIDPRARLASSGTWSRA